MRCVKHFILPGAWKALRRPPSQLLYLQRREKQGIYRLYHVKTTYHSYSFAAAMLIDHTVAMPATRSVSTIHTASTKSKLPDYTPPIEKFELQALESIKAKQKGFTRHLDKSHTKSLEDRITSNKKSLLERLGPAHTALSLKEPLSDGLLVPQHEIRNYKLVKRQEEFLRLIQATSKRLRLFLNRYPKLNTELFARFRALELGFHEQSKSYSSRQWTLLKRDCKSVGKISMELGKERTEGEMNALVRQRIFSYTRSVQK